MSRCGCGRPPGALEGGHDGLVRTGDSYDMRTFRSVSDESVYLVSIENETLGVQASGRPSRDLEEAERTAWAAIATAETAM